MVYAVCLGTQGFTYFLAGAVERRVGSKFTCILGGYILCAGIFLSALSSSLLEFTLYSGVLCGAGYGLAFTPALTTCIRWCPQHKGTISGIVLSGIGFGPLLFGIIANHIVNPSHILPTEQGYFSSQGEVANHVPLMYFILFGIYCSLISVGCTLLQEPPNIPLAQHSSASYTLQHEKPACVQLCPVQESSHTTLSTENTRSGCCIGCYWCIGGAPRDSDVAYTTFTSTQHQVTPFEMLRLPISYHLITCFMMTTVGGMYFIGTYKTYGIYLGVHEDYLSAIGAFSALANVFGRIFWGVVSDQMGAPLALTLLTGINCLAIFTYPMSIHFGHHGYGFWTVVLFFLQGGNMCLYMPINILLFGTKHASANYGIMYMMFSWCNVANITLLSKYKSSFEVACYNLGVLTLVGFVNTSFLISHYKLYMKKLNALP